MPRAAVVLLSLALIAGSATAAMSSTPLPQGYNVVVAANMYTGVDYVKLKKPAGPVVAHVARVLPNAPVDFRVVNAGDKVSAGYRDLENTSSMCGRVRCVVGVNGDFHRLGVPVGGIVSDGRMLKSPDPDRAQLTVTTQGDLVAGPLSWTGAFTAADGAQIPVTAVNTAPSPTGLVLYTSAFGASTPLSARTELLVKAPASIGAVNKVTELEVIGLRAGAGPIPADGAVLSGDGLAAQQLVDLMARQQAGMAPTARVLVSSPISISASLGVEPVVLRDGARAPGWRDPNLINPRQPHTLIGWNKAGETYLVAVDGRSDDSDGVTMAQAADFLLGLGATDAVSLDGGGGTTFAAGKSVWNRPSDGSERGAVNAFVVMAKPGLPLPPAAPPKPAPPQAPAGSPGTPGSTGTPGSPGSPGSPTSGGVVAPGTTPGTGSDTGGWPTTTDGSVSWPTPTDGYSITPGASTNGLRGNPEATVVVSPASAGGGVLPGVSRPRLILIDPPSDSAAVAGESALAATSDTVKKRAGRKGSTTSTGRDSSVESYLPGTSSDRDGSPNWGRGLRIFAALALGASAGALFSVRRRGPIFSF